MELAEAMARETSEKEMGVNLHMPQTTWHGQRALRVEQGLRALKAVARVYILLQRS